MYTLYFLIGIFKKKHEKIPENARFLYFQPTVTLEDLSRDGIISEDDANNVEMINGSNHEENLEPALEALITNSEMKENPFDQMVKEIRLGKFLKSNCG